MRQYMSIPTVLLLATVVHIDWHLARSHHHRLSVEWHYHWISGFLAFVFIFLFAARKRPQYFVSWALLNAVAGLFIGQIIEPWLEVLIYHVSVTTALSPERWRVFFEFLIAGLVGSLFGIALVYCYRRVGLGHEPQVR